MAPISTFAQISNYQINAVEIKPAQNKNDLLSIELKPFSIGDYAKIEKILIKKIEKLDDNVVEVAKFMQKLDNTISWRSGRLKKIIYNKAKSNREELKVLLLTNRERINNKQDIGALNELLLLADPELAAELKIAWNEVSLENVSQVELYYTVMDKIKNQLQKNIAAQPDNCHPNQAFFSRELLSALAAKDFSIISPDYTAKDFLEYKKTLFYLSRQDSPVNSIYLTYLYINSSVDYYYNYEWDTSAKLIKTKKGDCTEAATLYYTVLKMQGIVVPEFWSFIDQENISSIKHGYGKFYYEGSFYIYDNESIDSGKDYEATIKNSTTIKNYSIIQRKDLESLLLK